MRLIDADALQKEYMHDHDGKRILLVDLAPTIEERKKGKWGNHGECPFCSYLRQWEDDRFCGNCGAELR